MSDLKTKVMSIEQGRYMYDRAAKLLLSDIQLLSRIMHSVIPEYRDISIKDIEGNYIQLSSVSISKIGVADITPIAQKNTSHRPELLNTEDVGLNEANIYYDILFKAKAPVCNDEKIDFIINIEAQRSVHTSYPLEKRAEYYGARLLSSQLKTINGDTDYDSLSKVYSIWICMNSAKDMAGHVVLYRMYGNAIITKQNQLSQEEKHKFGLINIIMVYLNPECRMEDSTLELLRVLMDPYNSRSEKLSALIDNGVEIDEPVDGGIKYMSNLGEAIWQDGKNKERVTIILNMLNKGLSIRDAALYSGVSEEEVKKISENNDEDS